MTKNAQKIKGIYRETHLKFVEWSTNEAYAPYVTPPGTAPNVGFTIFYTKVTERPDLMIIGQNPSSFAKRKPLTDQLNTEWLSGTVPSRNSYLEDSHDFALTLRQLFSEHHRLLEEAVGMNVWHFQKSEDAHLAPTPLLRFCEQTTSRLLQHLRPRAVLCYCRPAYDLARGRRYEEKIAGTSAYRSAVDNSKIWYVHHPTARATKETPKHDMPIVLQEIVQFLNTPTTHLDD